MVIFGGDTMAVRLSFASERTIAGRDIDRNNPLLGRRVLVVDDSASQRSRLIEIFQSLGMHVVGEAENGLDALTAADRLQPDVISLDIIMPVMHGVETLGYLKQKNCDAVIIYVSALGGIESVSQLRSPGGHLPDAVFSKKDGRETYAEVLTSIFVGESEPSARSDSEESAASVQAV
jgi:two-component system, chemotaxis family, chemotaxis protein CheY